MSSIRIIGTVTASMIMSMIILLNILSPAIIASAKVADTTPPVTNASKTGTLGDNGWYISNASVNLTATDEGSGVNRTTYNLDDMGWNNYTGDLMITDGFHVLQYNSTDNESNAETAKTLNIAVDTQPPVTTAIITGTKNINDWYAGQANVTLTATDSASGILLIQYQLDSAGWTTYTFGVNGIPLSAGSHTIVYRSVDMAGHIEADQSVTVNVNDGAAKPISSMVPTGTPGIGGWFVSDVVVDIGARGGTGGIDHIEYDLDDAGWFIGNQLTVTTDGSHKLLYRAVDKAGNVEDYQTGWVLVDKAGPVISASISGDKASQGWYNGDVKITISATDYGSGVNVTQYCTDGSNWVTYSKPFTLGWSLSRSIYYRSVDYQGHYTNSSIYVYFNPPTFESYSLPSESVWINGVAITPTPTPTIKPTPTPTPYPTLATPYPTIEPMSTPEAQGGTNMLAIGVLLTVLAVFAIGGIALYAFVFKPK
jgi:hypothetical protein